ncbi:MAG: AAA family ATPase [bacterium]|nr:AAA family ATPase [bacterium]
MDPIQFVSRLNQEFKHDAVRTEDPAPWFGHFVLRSDQREAAYKIGDVRQADLHIIDWRHPLANAFYDLEPGQEFEMDAYQSAQDSSERYASLEGVVTRQTKITAKNRAIQRALVKTEAEALSYVATAEGFELEPLDHDRIRFMDGLPDVRSVLTKEQYRIITSADRSPVVIQGQAGSGKTTVALYRLSWLSFPKKDALVIDPQNVLIVMFNKALQSFVSNSLGDLGLEQAQVSTFHAWALDEVKKSYVGQLEPNTEGLAHQRTAQRIKKGLGMLNALEEFVQRQTTRMYGWMEDKLAPYEANAWIAELKAGQEPIVQRMISLRKKARLQRDQAIGLEKARLEQIYDVFQKGVTRLRLYKEELLYFLTDKELLIKHLPFESEESLEELAAYQRELQGIKGTERRPGPCVAFDDLALLLRLIQLKNGGLVDKQEEDQVNLYDHLVIDEAQDFGGLEMKVLLAAVRSKSGVTIVGDTNQKIVPEADFMGWVDLVAELGVAGAQVTRLDVGHRSTGPIMALAAKLLDERPSPGRPGAKPSLVELSGEPDLWDWLAEKLGQQVNRRPEGHICVVCRRPAEAKLTLEQLKARLPQVKLRLGHNNTFDFSAGVTITNLRQIKGLEFDQVYILEPSEPNYPHSVEGRRNLYTALTRAKEELTFLSTAAPSPLLHAALEEGLIDRVTPTSVEPVQFTEEDEDPF